MRRLLLLTIGTALAFVAPMLAQNQTPDLSGKWVLNLAKSKLAKSANIRSETLVISSSGSNVTMHFTADGNESTHVYVTDGKERVFAEVPGGQDVVKAYWSKSSLVVETFARLKMPNAPRFDESEPFRLKERWTLSSDGRVLTCNSAGFDTKTVTVYDKQ